MIHMKDKKDEINIAVIGCGYWGPNLIRNLFEIEKCNMLYVCDLDTNRLQKIRKRYPAILTITDYKKIIDNKDIDAVFIATPISTHYQIAKDLLNSKKHVFIEKPMAATSSESKELVRLSKSNSCILMVGHTFIYNPAVRKIKEILDKQELGKVYYIDSTRVNLGLHQSDVSVIWDLGPHDISIIFYLLDSTPLTVRAIGKSYVQENIYDTVFLILEFSDDILAHIHMSWLAPSKIRQTVIIGSKKMLVYNDTESDEKIKVYDKGVSLQKAEDYREFLPEYRIGNILSPKIGTKEPLSIECNHFMDCVLGNSQPETDGKSGLNVVKVLEVAEESLKKNGEVIEL